MPAARAACETRAMQFAERSRATGSIMFALVATLAMVAALAQLAAIHRPHHRPHHRAFALDLPRCREWIPPPPPAPSAIESAELPDVITPQSYDGVLASAAP